MNIDREEAIKLLKKNISNANLQKHCFAVEAIMGALAKKFGQDIDRWKLAGLLHDIDYEKTKGDPKLHSKLGAEMLQNMGFEEDICQAVLTHNEAHGILPKTKMAKALYCLDPLTGLIVASALVLPSKKLKDLKVENILNRFKEKRFAAGANREIIRKCEDFLGISLEKFVEIVLGAMQEISDQLGL